MPRRFLPLGDQAVMAYCDREEDALALAESARRADFPWRLDVVQAYSSVALFYDLAQINFTAACEALAELTNPTSDARRGTTHRIPVCYERGLDFARIEQRTGLARTEIIRLHRETIYTVYAIGFCPGFPYLGYLPAELAGVPRLESPRLRVEAGSVGLTGRQTGIYTEDRPGGWNIVGQTPLTLVDVAEGYFPLRTGDCVEFYAISEAEFAAMLGRRLGLN